MKILQLKSTFTGLMTNALITLFLLTSLSSFGTQYYVSTGGIDSNNGTSQNTPFKTLTKVNSLNLKPGDIVSLKGGQIFTSSTGTDFCIKIKNSGTANAPIILNSYGGGKATIQSAKRLGVYIENVSHIKVNNINLVGDYVGNFSGEENKTAKAFVGVLVKSSSKNCTNVVVENVQASKFKWAGIRFDSHKSGLGVQNSSIRNCATFLNGNRGIGTSSKDGGCNKNILITNCRTYDNHGWNSVPKGSGIHISGSCNVTVQHSVAYNNGAYNNSDAGGFGIWASGSSDVLFQFNESYNNKTRKADGGGFDIDGGVQRAVVQYNYSHGNDGAGFLVYQHNKGRTLKDITIRYNISENDGKKRKHAAIHVGSVGNPPANTENIFIYNNTIFNNDNKVASVEARKSTINNLKNIKIYNNLFIRPNGGNTFRINDSNNVDKLNNHTNTNGNSVVQNAGQGGTILPNKTLTDLSAYKLKNNPAVVNAGINLKTKGISNVGTRDFFGTSIPKDGAFDIGAHEFISIGTPCSELLVNNTFIGQSTNNITAWKTHKGGSANISSGINQWGVAQFNISNGGVHNYDLQFWQDGLKIEPGSTYTVKVKMRAAKNRTVKVIVRPVNFPNGQAFFYLDESINLTTAFKEYTFNFDSNRTESNARLSFLLGGNNGNVFIDQVSLSKKCNNGKSSMTNITSKQLAQIYPNPISNYLKVQLYDQIEDAEIAVFDAQGRLLQNQTISNVGETTVDVSELVSGSYFIRIKSEDVVETQKILKY